MSVDNIITKNKKEAYLPHTNKLPLVVVNDIWNRLLEGEEDKVKSLFCILMKETDLNLRKNNGYAPIPYELIKKKGYVSELERLKELGYVEYTGFFHTQIKGGGRCREYRLLLKLYFELATIEPARVANYINKGYEIYNAITFTKIKKTKKEISHEISKYNKKKKVEEYFVSDIVKDGILPIQYCLIDYYLIEEYLNFKREQMLCNLLTEAECLKYLNDERCYQSILDCKFEVVGMGRLIYSPRYRAQSSGRKSEIGGGAQSCSRDMKYYMFNFLKHKGVYNYDIKSSQIYMLRYELMRANLNYSILDSYLDADKENLAKEVGVDVDTWKGINYGAYFGGFPTKKLKTIKVGYSYKKDYGTFISLLSYKIVYKHICKFLGIETYIKKGKRTADFSNESLLAILVILKGFYNQNKDLLEELERWHEYLATNFLQSSLDRSQSDGEYIWNRSNMSLEMTQYMSSKGKLSSKGKRELASHLLQGQEAQFISCISKYSFEPDCPYASMNDQHDGGLYLGKIPESYIDRARKETGLLDIQYVIKDFPDPISISQGKERQR